MEIENHQRNISMLAHVTAELNGVHGNLFGVVFLNRIDLAQGLLMWRFPMTMSRASHEC